MMILKKHWFLVGLLILIPLGILLGRNDPPEWLPGLVRSVPTSICTGAILFLMSVTLDSGRLFQSLRKPLPVLLACGVNQLCIPLLCLPLLFLQASPDLRVGLLISASVPCTMAAASVWTRRAGGNDAVSLLVTLLTNGLCFVVTPLWMSVGTEWFGTSDASRGLGFVPMMQRLVLTALLPALAGQLLRLAPKPKDVVDRNKPKFSMMAQSIILFLVFVSCFKGGMDFAKNNLGEGLRHTEFLTVWVCCIGLHVAAMGIVWVLSGVLKLKESDRRATVIAGSQKTLPIGMLVSQATGLPFSLLPMLMYHASQLFIDTWVADRLAARGTPETSAPETSAADNGEEQSGDADSR
tara:strand:- start:108 stop:1163 length:1056 start_codon:yes stop_codon:yes gene_type:complete